MAIRIALAGNPNCGKTTMFNALTGANQYVGNWPGVTVEKKEGKLKSKKVKEEVVVTDLPGIYSLSPYTLEEVVSRDYLLKENPDVIVDLVVFCDDFRDAVRGSTFDEQAAGYASGNIVGHYEPVKFGIAGATQHPQVDYNGHDGYDADRIRTH